MTESLIKYVESEIIPRYRDFDAAHREEVREIGRQLDELGGMRAMRRVGEEFARRRPIHARKLETTWDGIGNWMG